MLWRKRLEGVCLAGTGILFWIWFTKNAWMRPLSADDLLGLKIGLLIGYGLCVLAPLVWTPHFFYTFDRSQLSMRGFIFVPILVLVLKIVTTSFFSQKTKNMFDQALVTILFISLLYVFLAVLLYRPSQNQ